MTKDATETKQLSLRILSPTGKLYVGNAVSVTAVNQVGPFDILGSHANFFSLLTACDVVVKTGANTETFPITKGLVKVKANDVTLFVDIEAPSVA